MKQAFIEAGASFMMINCYTEECCRYGKAF